MLVEHITGRRYIANMSRALAVSPGSFQRSNFVDAPASYISLLRKHIEKENADVFPLGNRLIPMNRQSE